MICDKCGTGNIVSAKFCKKCGNELIVAPENDKTIEELRGLVRDRYEITREIGRGGMAIVYLARDVSLDRDVALKVLPRDLTYNASFIEQFKHEVRLLAKIDHPNIVHLYSADSVDGYFYFTMKHVEGNNLQNYLQERGALSSREAVEIALQVCRALEYAHTRKVLHLDLKLENIMVDRWNHVYIMDFGIAKAMSDSDRASSDKLVGTPQFMAPEQWTGGQLDQRTDLYALGVVLYAMLSGRLPFEGETTSLMYNHIHEKPESLLAVNPKIDRRLAGLVDSLLEKKPSERPQSAAEAAKALEAAGGGADVPDGPLELQKTNLALVILFTVVSAGLYMPFWFSGRMKLFNSLTTREKFSQNVLGVIIILCITEAILFLYVWSVTAENPHSQSDALGIAILLFLALMILLPVLLVVQAFKGQRMLDEHFNLHMKADVAFSGAATFFLGAIYLQYKINALVEKFGSNR